MREKKDITKKTEAFPLLLQWAGRIGSDTLWAVSAFLFCSAILLFGVKQLFPEGDSGGLFFGQGLPLSQVSLKKGRSFQLNVGENIHGANPAFGEEETAFLTQIKNEVKNKRASGIVWENAQAGLKLYDRDAVQTLSNAKAVITFDQDNFIDMGENSLVIIRRLGRSRILKTRRSFMLVANGKFRGHVDGNNSGDISLQIALPTGVAEIDTKTSRDKKTEFEIHVLPDQSSTITVFKGQASVLANGKRVSIRANETTKIDAQLPPLPPRPVLSPVHLKAPFDQKIYYYRHVPPEISFTWTHTQKTGQYQLQIATDTSFHHRVFDEALGQSSFIHGNLKKGVYFWRVAAIDNQGIQGRWSPVRKIEMVQILKPPALKVLFPQKDEIVNHESIVVRGISDPNTQIYINGKILKPQNKRAFQEEVPLKKGINLILIESVDRVGNMSFERRLISRKY